MREIKYKDEVIARHIPANSWNDGLGFYSQDSEYLQVGTWKYNSGKSLLKHIHNIAERNVERTQEVIFVKTGKLQASIYSLDEILIETFVAHTGDIIILLNCGHGYEILEDNTEVLEIKNGPYLGADVDRRRF
ncbi:MAG TPA: hypothetical protein DIC42_05545 [Holosporales bacterium]|nr:hypothetical protein [Holosporales bacterium]